MSCIVLSRLILAAALLATGLANLSAEAQTPPASPSAEAQDVAKRTFEALPEPDRIALQDSLIWTGDYNGIASGKFGRATRDAIIAFASRNRLPSDGTLDAKGQALLLAAGRQAKEAARFTLKTDDTTGMRIGIPLKVLTKAKGTPTGTRYSTADDNFVLETSAKAAVPSLQDTFNATIAPAPERKVTYKILRPDFFVVAGEQGKTTFYVRMAQGDRGGRPSLVGITLTYPTTAKARFDPLLIAIANAFVPFPATSSPSPAETATPQNVQAAAGVPAASQRSLVASGVAVAPGLLLTSLPKLCRDPQIAGRTAKIVKQSETDGLSLLAPADPKDKAFIEKPVALGALEPDDAGEVVVLSFTRIAARDELMGAAGTLQKAATAGDWRLVAPVQSPVAGSAVFDQNGALVGLGPVEAERDKAVAGLFPQRSRMLVAAATLTRFLGDAPRKTAEASPPRTVGEVAASNRAALFPVTCVP